MTDGQLILAGGALLAAGLAASLFAARFRVPALVLVLGAGMLIGSDGTGWIEFDDYEVARRIGIDRAGADPVRGRPGRPGWSEIRPVLRPGVSLALVGTILTALLTGFVAAWLFDFSTLEGLLLGSVHRRHGCGRGLLGAADVDPAAPPGADARGRVGPERPGRRAAGARASSSGSRTRATASLDMAGLFAQQLSIGLAVGLAVGFAGAELLKRSRLASGGLYPVATLAIAAIAFGGVGRAARVRLPGRLPRRAGARQPRDPGAAHGVRASTRASRGSPRSRCSSRSACSCSPASWATWLWRRPSWRSSPWRSRGRSRRSSATAFEHYTAGERVVLGWAGLRGAVPVVLATFPVIEGVPRSQEFFNIAFFAVLLSTRLAGCDDRAAGRRLRPDDVRRRRCRGRWRDSATVQGLGAEVVEFPVVRGDAIVGDARARPGAAAGGARERDRARRAGDTAARVDEARGGDVCTSWSARRRRRRTLPAAGPLAQGPDAPGDRRRRGGLDDDAGVPRAAARRRRR